MYIRFRNCALTLAGGEYGQKFIVFWKLYTALCEISPKISFMNSKSFSLWVSGIISLMLKGALLVVSLSRRFGNVSLSELPALRSSLIGILTILSLNEKSPNVFWGVRRFFILTVRVTVYTAEKCLYYIQRSINIFLWMSLDYIRPFFHVPLIGFLWITVDKIIGWYMEIVRYSGYNVHAGIALVQYMRHSFHSGTIPLQAEPV